MGFEYASRTHVGLRRQINEDAMLVQPERGLWAVADGMGGHEAGEVASAKVVEALAVASNDGGLEAFVGRAITSLHDVNRELIRLAHSEAPNRTIGSTVVAIAIQEGQFRCFWAGDSRAYLVRGGSISQITKDHSLVQELVSAGLMEPSEADHHPNSNVITRAVGASDTLMVDRVAGEALVDDQFLLASDGLTRVVSDEEILAVMTRSTPGTATGELLEMVLARGAPDNVSIVVVKQTASRSQQPPPTV